VKSAGGDFLRRGAARVRVNGVRRGSMRTRGACSVFSWRRFWRGLDVCVLAEMRAHTPTTPQNPATPHTFPTPPKTPPTPARAPTAPPSAPASPCSSPARTPGTHCATRHNPCSPQTLSPTAPAATACAELEVVMENPGWLRRRLGLRQR